MSEIKDKIISEVYHEFYGSIKDTFTDAKKKDKTITYDDVKKWFDNNFTRKTNLKGYNSYIASEPFEEFQMDLFFINDLENQDYKIGLLMIDIFSKYMTVVPLNTKQPLDVLEGIKQCIKNMGENPISIYTDDEGSFNSKQVKQYFLDSQIQHIVTRGHAPVAERAIRTIKDLMYRRIEKAPDAQWASNEILKSSLSTYNNKMVNRSTKLTPSEARDKKNILTVKTNLELHRVKKRKYPDINVGDSVRVYTKKKNFQKERVPVWSENKYKVEDITENFNQKFYHIEGRDRPLLRHEILLVPNST
jgi:hypothetical protein